MLLVAQAVATIALVILVGFLARRLGALGEETSKVLADLTYWVLAPALLFSTLAGADLPAVMGKPLAIAAIAGVVSALIFAVCGRWLLRLNTADLTVGAMGASQNNAAYVGIPVALLVLGDAGHAIPIIVFQLGALTPTFFVLVDLVSGYTRPTIAAVARMVIRNPMVVAAALGIGVAASGLPVPELILQPAHLIGQAAAPTALLAFGAGLVGQKVVPDAGDRGAILLGVACKLVFQPLCAFGIASGLGLRGREVMTVTLMACLPTGQNTYIAAVRAGAGMTVARGVVLMTTLASLPVILLVASAFILLGNL